MEVINYLKRNNGSEHIVEHVGFHESGDYLLRILFSNSENPYRQNKYDVEKEYDVIEKSEIDKLERQTCGRRMQEFGPWERKEKLDHWKIYPNGDRICSFCGSLHPEDVISIVKKIGFGVVEKSTKNYKWYINRPEVSNVSQGGIKYYRNHDTQEFIDKWNSLIKEAETSNS